ncbi:SIS domain-containing protein [Pseudoroseomonas wenyumeiae]|uniref:SIS domain-containing protein n=2 Tax=Teichococcus wenyumeiae TaxID=2478470 RepID=A0A3A9JJ78_9PROT|nr:SIS domain-containing protein [Pseudoroseomonas wenyumeiae]RMI20586.1 SIS domain-containing protein [Pseudoroseomonas wenyumeiae]
MQAEIAEIPDAIERLLIGSAGAIADAGALLRRLSPPVVATVARGSSDHAASLFKIACEILSGVPVTSLGPSTASIYGTVPRLAGAAALAVSQSGRSPDLVTALQAARQGGAATIAIVNAEGSPLAEAADITIPLRAGPERSVAATKTFVGSAVAALGVLAAWREDAALQEALHRLPAILRAAPPAGWSGALVEFASASSLYVLGRGPGLAMAMEAALKFKETSILHAEAFSSAEVQHGPMSLVQAGFPVLAFLQGDAARPGMLATMTQLAAQGGRVFLAGGEAPGAVTLPVPVTGHPLTDCIAAIAAFYRFVEALSRARGLDPDNPPHLRKVTETL